MDKITPAPTLQPHLVWLETLTQTYAELALANGDQAQKDGRRQYLIHRFKQLEQDFENKEIPRPKHWGGFLVKPISVEFWQGRPNRLHDRITYTLIKDSAWKIKRLSP